MTEEQAKTEAAKRERHKPKSLAKNWTAVHDSVKGWHVALRADERQELCAAQLRMRKALRTGDMTTAMDAAADALMARVRMTLGQEPA